MRRWLVVSIFAASVFRSFDVYGQVRWFRFEGNPVLDVGAPGAWDNAGARIDRVIWRDSLFHAWYTGGNPPAIVPKVGYATSTDGVSWTRHSANPVLIPGPGLWDAEGSFRPHVTVRDSNFFMWYTGVASGPVFRIGLAKSRDGVVWDKSLSANPVLAGGGPGAWDTGAEHPSVLGPDSHGGYRMWYQGVPGFRLGYATAPDETTWSKYVSNPVFNSFDVFYPRLVLNDTLYELWYNIGRTQPASIGYSISPNGIEWQHSSENPVLRPGPVGAWDDGGLLTGDVLLQGGLYHLWYAGSDGAVFRSGYAVSPAGLQIRVSPDSARIGDTVHLQARVWEPSGLSFNAIMLFKGFDFDSRTLFDDGLHSDSLPGDGVFANTWVVSGHWLPPEGGTYEIVFGLRIQRGETAQHFHDESRYKLVVSDVEMDRAGIPEQYSLSQNYPNPFNPLTVITYSLPVTIAAKLIVYDVLGREVAVLADDRKSPGTHEARFDASGLSSGVYVYRLTAGGFTQSRRMLLLR